MATDPGKNYQAYSAPFTDGGGCPVPRARGVFRYVFLFLFSVCFLANGAYGQSLNVNECTPSMAGTSTGDTNPYDIEQILTKNNRIIGADIIRDAEAQLRALRLDDKVKTGLTPPSFGATANASPFLISGPYRANLHPVAAPLNSVTRYHPPRAPPAA